MEGCSRTCLETMLERKVAARLSGRKTTGAGGGRGM